MTGCDVIYCQNVSGVAECVVTPLSCLYSIMLTPAAVAAVATLAAAAVAGIVIASVVAVTAGSGVAVFVSQYAGAGAQSVLSVHENQGYIAQHKVQYGDNPLQSDLFSQ